MYKKVLKKSLVKIIAGFEEWFLLEQCENLDFFFKKYIEACRIELTELQCREAIQLLINKAPQLYSSQNNDMLAQGDQAVLNKRLRRSSAIAGQCSMIEWLLAQGAQVNVKTHHDEATALHSAAWYHQSEAVELLLKAKADANAVDNNGFTPLMYLIARDFPNRSKASAASSTCISLLLSYNAQVNSKDYRGRTALHRACVHPGNLTYVELLLAADANPNIADDNGITPLMLASQCEIIEKLLAKGADIHAKNAMGKTVLQYMVRQPELYDLLLAKGASPADSGCQSDLLCALAYNWPKQRVMQLIQAGTTHNIPDEHGITPLMKVAQQQNKEYIAALLSAGADIHLRDKKGFTALLHAVCASNNQAMLQLIDGGADINVIAHTGETLLSLSIFKNKYPSANWLLNKGISKEVINTVITKGKDKGYTPLSFMMTRCDLNQLTTQATIHLLLAKGADPNIGFKDQTVFEYLKTSLPQMRQVPDKIKNALVRHALQGTGLNKYAADFNQAMQLRKDVSKKMQDMTSDLEMFLCAAFAVTRDIVKEIQQIAELKQRITNQYAWQFTDDKINFTTFIQISFLEPPLAKASDNNTFDKRLSCQS